MEPWPFLVFAFSCTGELPASKADGHRWAGALQAETVRGMLLTSNKITMEIPVSSSVRYFVSQRAVLLIQTGDN